MSHHYGRVNVSEFADSAGTRFYRLRFPNSVTGQEVAMTIPAIGALETSGGMIQRPTIDRVGRFVAQILKTQLE